MSKAKKLVVQETEIRIVSVNDEDYISLTDMLKAKDGDFFYFRLVEESKYC
mgnify:CR=1 FL=1